MTGYNNTEWLELVESIDHTPQDRPETTPEIDFDDDAEITLYDDEPTNSHCSDCSECDHPRKFECPNNKKQ